VTESKKRLELGSVALLVAGLMFMEFLDGAILPTAAPTIARSFHLLSSQIGICVTTYMVTIVCLIPVATWLAEKYGVRKVMLSSITLFTIASVLCALSTNLVELTIMRILQGLGASTMVPIGRLVVMRSTEKNQVITAISYLVWPALIAPVVAPVLGGLIIAHLSWPWIFMINLPLGVFALLVAIKIVPDVEGVNTDKLDWTGFYGTTIALGSIVFGCAALGAPHINVTATIILFAIGVGIGWPTIKHFGKADKPLIDLAPMKIQTFKINNVSGLLYRTAHNTAPFALPLLFQDKYGWSAERSGQVLFFYMLGNFGFKVFTTPLMKRFRFKPLIISTTTISLVMAFAMAIMSSSLSLILMGILLVIAGSIRSLGMTLYNTLTYADLEQEMMAHANSLAAMTQQMASVFAVAVAVISMKFGYLVFGRANEFTVVFAVTGAMLLLSLIEVVQLPKLAGDSLRK
jgi:MFS family permease